MKEQDKTSPKKPKCSGDRQPSRKRIQNNDSENDLGSGEKNGGKLRKCKKCYTKAASKESACNAGDLV